MSRLTSEGNIYRRLRLWRLAHRPEFSTLIPKQWTLKLHEPVEYSSHETVEFYVIMEVWIMMTTGGISITAGGPLFLAVPVTACPVSRLFQLTYSW